MKIAVKSAPKPASTKKLDVKQRVKQGTGRNVIFMSDTLFDDDLKK